MSNGPTFLFNPARVQRCNPVEQPREGVAGDDRDGRIYVYHESDIVLAVNVALATGRPLLLSGPSGCGKSSLARNVALSLGWRYYEHVITSRTEARDLLWRFDSLRRLNDAQAQQVKGPAEYIEPGVLWWAFDRDTARQRGSAGQAENATADSSARPAKDPCYSIAREEAVLLIDEIDKADVDVPNNLLVPLGSKEFTVEPTGFEVKAHRSPLIFITTNGERELPVAFLRRCVALELPGPTEDKLVEIATAWMSKEPIPEAPNQEMLRDIARLILAQGKKDGQRVALAPSTAEYLDTVRACQTLNITPKDPIFMELTRITLRKRQSAER